MDLKKLSVATKDFSGADLQAVLYTAQLLAVEQMLSSGKVNLHPLLLHYLVRETFYFVGNFLQKMITLRCV